MAKINGIDYKKEDLLRYCGNINQIAAITETKLKNNLELALVKTGGGLEYNVVVSKGLDISSLSYKGINISFLSKNGLANPANNEFLSHMTGGMIFTCGLRNAGIKCVDNGEEHPQHGKIGTIAPDNSYTKCYWDNDDYILETGGVLKETALFGHNLYLTRTLKSKMGENFIEINDVVENLSDKEEEFMIIYHFNFGFPFLDENLKLIFPKNKVTARTKEANDGIGESERITRPIDGFFEHVFFRDVEDENGTVILSLENERLGVGAYIKYNKENLDNLAQWKSMKSGDYALGIEPCNCFIKGRVEERKSGTLKKIAPFSKLNFNLVLGFYDLNK